ncbi:uncharacterized protein BO72DRAFT_292867 [Aspergillus fijiensis CBS 313.89]|uniref:Uncharacterized protein n=1 Tax=Aspergillus fijiensis CBS 313.89 TaxID=1448319 RepID=A0A8G1RFZ9_9EURO|nr:uncharacterized protein BO72DRAFT_292867 [Aspergillus fijiensis CBS 313.89]RAK72058.1 hypothetical protein BO72DRAFT_292867 [Aspergillus fijiensis CBS 313.89]
MVCASALPLPFFIVIRCESRSLRLHIKSLLCTEYCTSQVQGQVQGSGDRETRFSWTPSGRCSTFFFFLNPESQPQLQRMDSEMVKGDSFWFLRRTP